MALPLASLRHEPEADGEDEEEDDDELGGAAGVITFSPRLPDWKAGALSRLYCGAGATVLLEYRSPFWLSASDGVNAASAEAWVRGAEAFGLLRPPMDLGAGAPGPSKQQGAEDEQGGDRAAAQQGRDASTQGQGEAAERAAGVVAVSTAAEAGTVATALVSRWSQAAQAFGAVHITGLSGASGAPLLAVHLAGDVQVGARGCVLGETRDG